MRVALATEWTDGTYPTDEPNERNESERAWIDAVNQAVVTSNQLRIIPLKARERLLGDWFRGRLGLCLCHPRRWQDLAYPHDRTGIK